MAGLDVELVVRGFYSTFLACLCGCKAILAGRFVPRSGVWFSGCLLGWLFGVAVAFHSGSFSD